MKGSRIFRSFFGFSIMLIGLGGVLGALGWFHFTPGHLFPFLLLYFGLRFWQRSRRKRAVIFLVFGIWMLFKIWFGIHVGHIIGLVFSLFIMYAGYRLLSSPKVEQSRDLPAAAEPISPIDSRDSLFGSQNWLDSRFELRQLAIWQGIGEVKMDLSRAVIPEGESLLIIQGWIGDIDLYIPYDLPFPVIVYLNAGNADILGQSKSGVQLRIIHESPEYQQAEKRVRIIVNLLVGELDIKYV